MFWVTLISFLFFTALVAVGTWLIVRNKEINTQDGFFLAGRQLSFPFIAGSLLLTNLSTEQMVGLNGSAFKEGLMVMVWETLATISLVIMALFFLPRFLKAGVTTVPEYLMKRFDRRTGAICNLIFMCFYTFVLLPTILYTGAVGLNGILDMKGLTGIDNPTVLLWLSICFIGLIGTIYALFGGLRSVAVSDLLNGIGLLIGGFMIFFFALKYAGDGQGIFKGLSNVYNYAPDKFNSIGGPDCSVPFGTVFTGVLLINMFYWCTNQQIIQRTFGAKSLVEGQKGVMLCGALKLLGPFYLVLPGIIAFYVFRDDAIAPDHAYGLLVNKVLPAPLAGFFASVLTGAVLSSFNSVLNSTCTLFSLGLYKEYLRPNASEKQVVNISKYFGWIVAMFAMLTAPLLANTEGIFHFLKKMDSVIAMPIFAVVLMAMLTKKVPAMAANISLIVGCVIILILSFVSIPINAFHMSAIMFLIMVVGMLIAGRFFPQNTIMPSTDPVNMSPWKYRYFTGVVLTILVILSFALFAR